MQYNNYFTNPLYKQKWLIHIKRKCYKYLPFVTICLENVAIHFKVNLVLYINLYDKILKILGKYKYTVH